MSRACELSPGIMEVDKSLFKDDTHFVKLIIKIRKNMKNFKRMKQFPRGLIPDGNTLTLIVSCLVWGIPDYGTTAYIISETKEETEDERKLVEENKDPLDQNEITTMINN